MNRRLLVTRPDTDRTTRYISAWAGKILEVAESKGDIVFDLSKERANKKEIESILLKKEPEILFLNGHGDKNCVTGQNNEVLIDAIHNAHLLKGKIIYALACKSGEGLGPASIVAGRVRLLVIKKILFL